MRDPGTLDRQIVIQKFTTSTNTYGEEVKTWSTHSTVWAALKYLSGGEAEESGQIIATNKVIFVIRHDSAVIPSYRISYNSKTYEIESVIQIGREHWMELYCKVKDNE